MSILDCQHLINFLKALPVSACSGLFGTLVASLFVLVSSEQVSVSGESAMIMEIELQSQVLDAINYVLYDQLKFKGNRMDYYNALNLYMHQVNVGVLENVIMI